MCNTTSIFEAYNVFFINYPFEQPAGFHTSSLEMRSDEIIPSIRLMNKDSTLFILFSICGQMVQLSHPYMWTDHIYAFKMRNIVLMVIEFQVFTESSFVNTCLA